MIDKRWSQVKRVLAIRLDNLGDVLVTTPALHAIKTSLPAATLTLLTSPVGAQVARLNPDLDDVIVYQAPWMDPWHKLPQDSQREQQVITTIRERRFDGAIIFTSFRQSPLPAAYLCYLADIPLRVAASIDGPGSLLTTRHKHPPITSHKGGIAFQLPQGGIAEREQLHKNDETWRSGLQVLERMMHEVERGLDLVATIGLTTEDLDLVLHVPADARTHIDDLLASYHVDKPDDRMKCRDDPCGRPAWDRQAYGRPAWDRPGCGRPALIAVHPGCSMPARTYPWEMYVEVVDLLVEQLGATVFLTGAEDEQELVERILSHVQEGNRRAVHSLAGVLSFPALCALIEAADLVITNNTGPMHISAAVKTPVVALFALTNPPEQWGPWHVPHRLLNVDVPCRICYSRACPYQHECLRLVSPSMVVDAASGLLKHVGREQTVS